MKRILIGITGLTLLILTGFYVKQIIHETVETRLPGQHYLVSLGDSVAAGAGLDPARNPRNPGCDLAPAAYPNLIGRQLKQPVQQFACSGAKVGTAMISGGTLFDQLRSAEPYLNDNVVVVTAGANDVGWLTFLLGCARDNCATEKNRTDLAAKIDTMQRNLIALLKQLESSRPRTILVNTYYDLLKPGDACAVSLGISPEEAQFIHEQEELLNTAIGRAATANKADAVPVDFSGYLLCDADPWVQGVTDPAPLHPTAAGQARIADQDVQILSR